MASRKRTIEMTWRCSACSTVNRGRDKVCVSCGDPKDASEKFEMPGDTRAAASVQDPELLKKARAGKDWRCHHCGASCSALLEHCAQCGAPRGKERPAAGEEKRGWHLTKLGFLGLFLAVGAMICCLGYGVVWWGERPREVTVAALDWTAAVRVERYAAWTREGFAETRPATALEVTSLGPRHHHDIEVLDGYTTEYYTEQVACGEDCYDVPETCSESCTSDDNGFATCTETCSGGGQSCTTRYCSEQRSREVPHYHTEAVNQEYFQWKNWEWGEHRVVEEKGTTLPVRWPSEQKIALKAGLAKGEDERATRAPVLKVRFDDEDGESWWWQAPDEATYAGFPPGSAHVIRVRDEVVEVVPPR